MLGDTQGVASLNPGTCKNELWLLPSGPDQIHSLAMRGGPPLKDVMRNIVKREA